MIEGLLGKKIGMTHLFASEAKVIPVTVLEVGPCVVTQVKTQERDGYEAVQIGYGTAKLLNKPALGHLSKAATRSKLLREFKTDNISSLEVGQQLDVSQFQAGDLVDIVSTTKGRGFQGAMRRHGFRGGKATHGQGDRGRAVGSIGAGTDPGRVLKGKKMPGHMGNKRKTIRRLKVESVDKDRNLLMVRGPIPGARNTMVMVRYAHGVALSERIIVEDLVSAEDSIELVETLTEEATEAAAANEVETSEASTDEEEATEAAAANEVETSEASTDEEEATEAAAANEVETSEASADEEKEGN